MSTGLILLIIAGLLIAFGVGQRALDRLRLTDAQAYVFIALIIILGFIPAIRIGQVGFNLGGSLVPFVLCMYLFFKADTAWERWRSIIASIGTGAAVWAMMRFLPNEPETMPIDPNWLYGLAAAVIAYILGRSRRCAFIGGVVGVLLAQLASAVPVWMRGIDQELVLGGAGVFDAVVIAGFLGVMVAELVGEIIERIVRGKKRPSMEFRNGGFAEVEKRK